MKKVILAGATGLVGKKLFEQLSKNFEVIVIGRESTKLVQEFSKAAGHIEWSEKDGVINSVNNSYGIINLAGAPIVGKKWTHDYKKVLHDSRISTTRLLVDSIAKSKTKPIVFINASAVGYYGTKDQSAPFVETDSPGTDFLAKLCVEWEKEVTLAEKYNVRTVIVRSGIILDKNEGALPKMVMPFKFFVGGPIGNGEQKFPWIHIDDEVGIILFALENKAVKGPINAVAPDSITSSQLSSTIGKVMRRPNLIPVPKIALRILYGESSQIMTTGIGISSEKITRLGYKFKCPTIAKALTEILNKKYVLNAFHSKSR